ncbi:MAG: hypothetical protein CL811_12865, partial [Colwelliaceae bacterium]|nr:hypothetical protein [Colwelliaceae bacterium]
SKWHLLKNKERKEIVKQTCKYLKIINNSNYKNFIKRFKINCPINWQNKILTRIKKHLDKAEKRKLLKKDLIENIKEFVELNKKSLRKQKMALVYWDIHFDNILINNKKIVGILDFERTELASIDFTLDIVKRMVDYPKKYMAEKFEKLARKKDYEKLLNWFEEFYPDLFKFKDLDSRLALYSLEHDLDTLLWYPKSKDVRKMIAKTVGFKLK